MNADDLLAALLSASDDVDLSRGERRALRAHLVEVDETLRPWVRRELVEKLADRMHDPRDAALLRWLSDALPLLDPPPPAEDAPPSRAWFGPDGLSDVVARHLAETRERADIAVFTITDDRLTDAILALHDRGVRVRILSDDDKSHDEGSDVRRLRRAGVPVRVDASPHHFHHKFAVLDQRLLNGSYNWTRGADLHNRENLMVTHDRALVDAYAEAFEAMWAELAP